MKRVAVLVACAVALVCVAAFAGGSTVPRNARVIGVIRLCGGPFPGRCFTQDGSVFVLDSKHKVVASQHTRHAYFSFVLRPGDYKLVAKTGGTRVERSVVAKAHRTVHASIVIAVP
jgi:hypothetical protein